METFDTVWQRLRRQVYVYCLRVTRDPQAAEDVTQQVALKSWHRFAHFRGECPVDAWVMIIAKNELSTFRDRSWRRARLEIETEDPAMVEQAVAQSQVYPDELAHAELSGYLADVIPAACAAGELSAEEARVVGLWLRTEDLSWDDIGAQLGMTGNACAVANCRAIPKLRVFLFVARPELLGGTPVISIAYEAAVRRAPNRWNALEREAFEEIVLKRRSNFRRSGWRTALRAACDKVIQQLMTT